MLHVTMFGPMASGKTRTIRAAIPKLERLGLKVINNEERPLDHSELARREIAVAFTSKIENPGQLRFAVHGNGPARLVAAAVGEAFEVVTAENEKRAAAIWAARDAQISQIGDR